MPQKILISLLGHGHHYHKDKRHEPARWRNRRDVTKVKSKEKRQKEIKVGYSSKLLVQIDRYKGPQGVLGGAVFVGFSLATEADLDFLQVNVELSVQMVGEFVANDKYPVVISLMLGP